MLDTKKHNNRKTNEGDEKGYDGDTEELLKEVVNSDKEDASPHTKENIHSSLNADFIEKLKLFILFYQSNKGRVRLFFNIQSTIMKTCNEWIEKAKNLIKSESFEDEKQNLKIILIKHAIKAKEQISFSDLIVSFLLPVLFSPGEVRQYLLQLKENDQILFKKKFHFFSASQQIPLGLPKKFRHSFFNPSSRDINIQVLKILSISELYRMRTVNKYFYFLTSRLLFQCRGAEACRYQTALLFSFLERNHDETNNDKQWWVLQIKACLQDIAGDIIHKLLCTLMLHRLVGTRPLESPFETIKAINMKLSEVRVISQQNLSRVITLLAQQCSANEQVQLILFCLEQLESQEPNQRQSGIYVVTAIANALPMLSDDFIKYLLDYLKQIGPQIVVVNVLGVIAPKIAELPDGLIQTITALLKNDDWKVSQAASDALNAMIAKLANLPDNLIKAITSLLGDGDPAAISALGAMASKITKWPDSLTNAINGLLKNCDPSVRITAANALGAMAPKVAELPNSLIQAITGLLNDDNPSVRTAAVNAVAAMAPKIAGLPESYLIDIIISLLQDYNWHVRQAAIYALGAIVPKFAKRSDSPIKAITRLLEDTNPTIRITAVNVLVIIAPNVAELAD